MRPLIKRLYEMEGCGVGGPLHIVTDDGNLTDGSIQYCLDLMDDPEWPWRSWDDESVTLARDIATKMLRMTGTQRRKLC